MNRILIAVLFSAWACIKVQAEVVRIVSYNVENFFHPAHDSLTNDLEWTPDGERRWSFKRYSQKAENIARVLTTIGEWEGVELVGLCEVENATCLRKLCWLMRRDQYGYVHYESPDARGIDVALLFRQDKIDTLFSRPLRVDLGETTTRDILYVCAIVRYAYHTADTLHLFVCHLPSQLGGKAESEWKRTAARSVLQSAVDSVLQLSPQAKIIVMGDMNDAPKNTISGLTNRMMDLQREGVGTHKWRGQWTCLDQFYTSAALTDSSSVRVFSPEWLLERDEKFLGHKPLRCYIGFRYQNGFSDHLPVVLTIQSR